MNKSNQNLTVGCQTGSRFMRFIITVMFIVPLMLGMSSCSSDDAKDDEPIVDNASVLYGAWVAEETISYDTWTSTIIFNSNGNLWSQEESEVKAPGSLSTFTGNPVEYIYEVFSNTLKIYESDNTTKTPDSVLSFKVVGDKLTLECISGDNPAFLSHFTNKAVTFTRK